MNQELREPLQKKGFEQSTKAVEQQTNQTTFDTLLAEVASRDTKLREFFDGFSKDLQHVLRLRLKNEYLQQPNKEELTSIFIQILQEAQNFQGILAGAVMDAEKFKRGTHRDLPEVVASTNRLETLIRKITKEPDPFRMTEYRPETEQEKTLLEKLHQLVDGAAYFNTQYRIPEAVQPRPSEDEHRKRFEGPGVHTFMFVQDQQDSLHIGRNSYHDTTLHSELVGNDQLFFNPSGFILETDVFSSLSKNIKGIVLFDEVSRVIASSLGQIQIGAHEYLYIKGQRTEDGDTEMYLVVSKGTRSDTIGAPAINKSTWEKLISDTNLLKDAADPDVQQFGGIRGRFRR